MDHLKGWNFEDLEDAFKKKEEDISLFDIEASIYSLWTDTNIYIANSGVLTQKMILY